MKTLATQWLAVQTSILPGVRRAVLFHVQADGATLVPAATWPNAVANVEAAVAAAASKALQHGTPVVRTHPDDDMVLFSAPVGDAAVVAVEASCPSSNQHQVILQLLEWGQDWYRILDRERVAAEGAHSLKSLVDVIASGLEHERFADTATRLVTEIAAELQCERVSLGLQNQRWVRVQALSHSARIDRRSTLLRQIATAMEEAIDQDATVCYPPTPSGPALIAFAQEVLSEQSGAGTRVCTTPLYNANEAIGAITLERTGEHPFTERDIDLCESLGAMLGPILSLKYANDRPLVLRGIDRAREFLSLLLGPRNFVLKIATVAIVGLVVALALVTSEYRVKAEANIEAAHKRIVAAPQSGFIHSVPVRPGDSVSAGQVLVTLDDSTLKVERLKLRSELERYSKEQRAALSNHDRAAGAIARARMAQAKAQLRLVDERLERTRIAAPYPAVVVSGDLTQSLGAPVDDGDVLFEIAPLDAYRVRIQVDERDIADVAPGQRGMLALASRPGDPIEFTVERIHPVSSPADGKNTFPVEARLDEEVASLRPGMSGVAKLDAGTRKLAWIWSHDLVDWIRVTVWGWTG